MKSYSTRVKSTLMISQMRKQRYSAILKFRPLKLVLDQYPKKRLNWMLASSSQKHFKTMMNKTRINKLAMIKIIK